MVVGTVVCLIKFVDLLPRTPGGQGAHEECGQGGLAELGVGTEATSDALSKLDPAKLAEALTGLITRSWTLSGACSSW